MTIAGEVWVTRDVVTVGFLLAVAILMGGAFIRRAVSEIRSDRS